ncbi:hypothetical protein [Streptomyces globisporus]|uniref:hypothetical protein n=1 Tax=Streptomyces globisporus TaxID=1908 RepID=UPI003682AB46
MIGTALKLARGVVETVPGGVEEAVKGGVGSPDAFRASSGVVDAGSALEERDLDHGFCEVGECLPRGARRVSLHEHSQVCSGWRAAEGSWCPAVHSHRVGAGGEQKPQAANLIFDVFGESDAVPGGRGDRNLGRRSVQLVGDAEQRGTVVQG